MRGTPIDDLEPGDLISVEADGDVTVGYFVEHVTFHGAGVLTLRLDKRPAPYRTLSILCEDIEVISRHKRAKKRTWQELRDLIVGRSLIRLVAGGDVRVVR